MQLSRSAPPAKLRNTRHGRFALHFYYTTDNKTKRSFQGSAPQGMKSPSATSQYQESKSIHEQKEIPGKEENKKMQVTDKGQLLSSEKSIVSNILAPE